MKQNKPFFSIVIPTLNEEIYLPELLKDLSKQIFRDFEVVVVDGKSEDKTATKALNFGNRFPKLRVLSSKKRNVAIQRNLGGKRAAGKWIIFMDADNRLAHHFLEGIKYRISVTHPDLFTCWCKVDKKDPLDLFIEKLMNVIAIVSGYIGYQTAPGAMIGITKKGFGKTKGFDPKRVPLEDGEFVREAIKKKLQFKIFRDPVFVYSLRRFQTGSKFKGILTYVLFSLKIFLGLMHNQKLEYQMGGRKNRALFFPQDMR